MAIRSNGSVQITNTGAIFPAKRTPGPISTFSATPSSGTQMNISWSAPSDNGNDTVTGYRVEWAVTSIGTYTTHAANQAGTTASITGLTNGTNYTFRITPTNSVGFGQSNTFTATLRFGLGTLTYQEFTSSGTWTAPSGVTSANIWLLGGGGGGGNNRTGTGGGGATPKIWLDVPVTPGTGYAITIGAGGANTGSAQHGSSTTFATNYIARGAPGGSGSTGGQFWSQTNVDDGPGSGFNFYNGSSFVQSRQIGFTRQEFIAAGWGNSAGGSGNVFTGQSDAPQNNYWMQPTGGSNFGPGGQTTTFTGSVPPGGSRGTDAGGYGNGGGAWFTRGSNGLARVYWYA